MSSIGFPVETIEEMRSLGKQAVVHAQQTIPVAGIGYYRVWSPGSGAQLWMHVTQGMEIVGMEPHFSGEARMKVRLLKRVRHAKDTILEGAFFGWANPHEGVTTDGDYPFCFDAQGYRMHDGLTLPCEVSVQLAAFPNELLAFDDAAEARGSKTWMKDVAGESCIPSGTFIPGKGPLDPPKPEIIFCGTVQETSKLTNPATGRSFFWAKVRTLGGELDVVADPTAVKGTIKKKGIVGSMCYISGRIK